MESAERSASRQSSNVPARWNTPLSGLFTLVTQRRTSASTATSPWTRSISSSLPHGGEGGGLPQPVLGAAALGVAVHQGEVAGTGRHEVGQQPLTEAAQAAGHEIGRLRVQQRPPVVDGEVRRGRRGRRLEHELALVLARGHEAERFRVVAVGEDGDGQRRHHAAIEQVEAGLGKLAREQRIVDHQAVEVDGGEAQVLAEDAEAEGAVGEDVDLADLAVPAARPQGFQAERHVAAGQRVQNDIHALAAGRLHQPVVPVLAVGIEGGPDAQFASSCSRLLSLPAVA